MANIAAILRSYEQRRHERKDVSQSGHTKPAAPGRHERELVEDAYVIGRFAEIEAETIHPDTKREPRSIHSPAPASRLRFQAPVKRGQGRTQRWAQN